jgi:hypothetical protein
MLLNFMLNMLLPTLLEARILALLLAEIGQYFHRGKDTWLATR